jgi:hypothetical protein
MVRISPSMNAPGNHAREQKSEQRQRAIEPSPDLGRLPVGERAIKPSLRRSWRGLSHGLDERELPFVDAHA